jgi:prepilin signal peptidase PulO-like enzyme (type II secretory pathway)
MSETTLRLAIGVLVGAGLGWVAWLVARRFARGYRAAVAHYPATQDPDMRSEPAGGSLLVATVVGMAAWGGYAAARAEGPPQATSAVVVTALLLAISLVDFQVRRIPDALVGALLGWAVVQIAWLGTPGWSSAALGLLVGGGIFLLLALITRGTMGMGDVKLMAAAGVLVGYPLILQAIFWGVVAGGAAALVLLLARRVRRKDFIAYGPYLALGTWLITAKMLGLWG